MRTRSGWTVVCLVWCSTVIGWCWPALSPNLAGSHGTALGCCFASRHAMHVNQPPETSPPLARGSVCVVIAAGGERACLDACRRSVRAHTLPETPVHEVSANAAAVNRALEQLAPADVVVLDGACRVSSGWLERLGDAARSDTNVATA